ncbi:MAG: hypothetical protein M1817_001534 [Caeruleum heppii]|nr:MAG: hypothetical protein M1817_001534 [Caeruleum heppii]
MPTRQNKRKLEDPTASDPEDENYDSGADRQTRRKPSTNQRTRPAKRKRTKYGSDDISPSEDDSLAEESFEDEIEEEEDVEIDERTGRPKRNSTKKPLNYVESDDNSDDIDDNESEEPEEERPKKVIKLKIRTPKTTPAAPSRTTRAGSSGRGRRGPSAEPLSSGTRRSGRLHNDEHEPIIALTTSGRHAQIIRPATQSPEREPPRSTVGRKGIKAPAASAIFEEEEAGSLPPTQDVHNLQGSDDDGAAEEEVPTLVKDSDEEREPPIAKPEVQDDTAEAGGEADQTEVGGDADKAVGEEPGNGQQEEEEEEDGEDDEGPVTRHRRAAKTQEPSRSQRSGRSAKKPSATVGHDRTSDFEFNPTEASEEEISSSEASETSPRKASRTQDDNGDDSGNGRRSGRLRSQAATQGRTQNGSGSEHNDSEVAVELAEELQDLQGSRPRRPRRGEIIFDDAPKLRHRKKPVDYRILRPDAIPTDELEAPAASTPSRRGRGGGNGSWQRTLFSTYGPFGGAGGPPPVFGGPGGIGAAAGADSDSSDEERPQRFPGYGGPMGMTPTTAMAPALIPSAQAHNADAAQGAAGTPANLGKIKDRKLLADADPLGVDQNVSFDSVGGLENHINQLKEMVSLPLLYPEIFQRFHVTPPRGVLFHGPPGTGKTLLARALAASVSSEGRKITFYMRKGADALSKWVGEAERQLRLLFDEARANQPSIIFFDEIDGLAPVRSSKQEQIHASIVSTLLALMDGMDGRGQVIVIGATNRPDNIDPALRRPGRFDREFYFPLPGLEARRKVLDIHTAKWTPGLSHEFKDQLADLTKGYGGADLRALCTEAALNAVQRRYPQIYTSNEKLMIDPSTITITAKDFMISVKKMVPSSERSTSSGAGALPKRVEPLLRQPLQEIKNVLSTILPQKKTLTALEEAQFEETDDADGGFARERVQQDFETSRVFRPRLLIRGAPGMGQQYLAGALLNHFEGLHVQSFDLPTLLSDSTRSPEAAVVQLFAEVRRHKPGVIYIPNVDTWYRAVGSTVISTFLGLLRGLPPTDPVLLLGIMESDPNDDDKGMLKELFGYSKHNVFELSRPDKPARKEYFEPVASYIRRAPNEFPDPDNRKRRKLERLEIAPPPPPPKPPTKEELQAQKKKDRQVLNYLKIRIQPVMDQIKKNYKRFRAGVVEDEQIKYLYDEQDPSIVDTDLAPRALFRPFEKGTNKEGVSGLLEVESGKFYYNLNIVVIEERLSNGWYKRPRDFVTDIRYLAKDARTSGDRERTVKANEMLANVEVDMAAIESDPTLADCENVYLREEKRAKEKAEKLARLAAAEAAEGSNSMLQITAHAGTNATSEQTSSGPVPVPGVPTLLPVTPSRPSNPASLSNGYSAGPSNSDGPRGQLPQSNGSSFPSHSEGDVHMADSDESLALIAAAPHSGTQDHSSLHASKSQPPATQSAQSNTQRSQTGPITVMPAGSQVGEFANDASTTTESQQKPSSHSNPSSGDRWNTQSSNGVHPHVVRKDRPDFSATEVKTQGDSQLPDTQGTSHGEGVDHAEGFITDGEAEVASSQGSGAPSSQSQPPVPAFNAPSRQSTHSSIAVLLNDPVQESSHQPQRIVEPQFIQDLHEEMTKRASGCSVEQLEQINTALMDSIWRQRHEWNRTLVGMEVKEVFNAIMADIEYMQDVEPASLQSRGLQTR